MKTVDQCQGVRAAGDAGAAPAQALGRRTFLVGLSATALAIPLVAVMPAEAIARTPFRGVVVRPRADWALGLAPTGAVRQEGSYENRFVVVQHTTSAEDY